MLQILHDSAVLEICGPATFLCFWELHWNKINLQILDVTFL